MSLTLLGGIAFVLGVLSTIYSLSTFRSNARREVEGVDTFDQQARHEMMRRRAKLTGNAGVVLIIAGVLMSIGGAILGGRPEACERNPYSQACYDALDAAQADQS